MQVHIEPKLQALMWQPANQEMRNMIKVLFDEPIPGWVYPVEGYTNRYEFYANSVHIQYRIDDTGLEMIIKVTLADEL